MKVVAISGWKGSGKDMLADHLVRVHGATRVAFADPLKDRVAEEFSIPRWWLDNQEFKEKPLMEYPVNPQDAFSLAIAKLMCGEFRDAKGRRPSGCEGGIGNFNGIYTEDGHSWSVDLYWTPRALAIFKGSGNRAVTSKYWVEQAVKKIREEAAKDIGDAMARGDNSFEPIIVMSDVRFRSEVSQLRDAFGNKLITVRVNRFDTCNSTDASERDLDNAQFDYVLENKGTIKEAVAKIEQAANLRW